jgi:hypothetical protein
MLLLRKISIINNSELLPVAKQSFINAFEKDNNSENVKLYVAKAFTEEVMLEEL